ncbi:MAG: carbohydrate-binding protein [Dysgonomonas sp.]
MKNSIDKIILLFLLSLVAITSCDNYDRTDAVPAIFVNHESLDMFVGDEIQLIANPQGGTYDWQSEDTDVVTVSNGKVNAVGEGVTNIIVREGAIYTRVPVTVVIKVPLTGVELSTDRVSIFVNAKASVIATQVPLEANSVPRTDFEWWTENESIAMVNSKGDIVGISEGITTIYYRKGTFVKTVVADVASTRPFKGPHNISKAATLILPVRDFDFGGEGNAYHDTDASNSAGSNYRQDNGDSNSPGVDVEGGGNIGYTNDGEWLLYTVEVVDAGIYAVQLSASGQNNGLFHLEVDGVDKTGKISVPSNGSWSNWTWRPATPLELTLTEGKHKIKLYIDQAGFNINELKFEFLR